MNIMKQTKTKQNEKSKQSLFTIMIIIHSIENFQQKKKISMLDEQKKRNPGNHGNLKKK